MKTQLSPASFAQYIDHTCLKVDAKESDIVQLCSEAVEFKFKGVCVEINFLEIARKSLSGSNTLLVTVVGFPKGNESTLEKVAQTEKAVSLGAQEIDMVLNRNFLAAREYTKVLSDIQAVVKASGANLVKVILETSELNPSQIAIACALAKVGGAKFVKTSTGFSKSGAKEEDIRLMRECVGPDFGVKASGGVKTLESALQMIDAGANRLGMSSSVSVMKALSDKI